MRPFVLTEDFPSEILSGGGWINHLIFYRIPKNASTSLFKHLGQLNLIKKYEQKFNDLADKRLYKGWFDPTHAKPQEVFRVLGHEMANYFSFCVVRNPWDRAVSMYHFAKKHDLQSLYGIKGEISFETFCEILRERQGDSSFIGTNKQIDWISDPYPPKYILRFENLQKDFEIMLNKFNIHHISPQIPHLNATNHASYKDYYNERTKTIIESVFADDIYQLRYQF